MTTEIEQRVTKLETDMADHREVLLELKGSFDRLNDTVQEQMENLIKALTGVNRIDVSTLNKVVLILGAVIVSLLFVVVFLLTGEKLPLPTKIL